MFGFFKKKSASFLGVDIGTTNIKVVQLGIDKENIKLEDYAFLENRDYLKVLEDGKGLSNLKISDMQVVEDLTEIKKKAEITSDNTIMSIPMSSAFFSVINLPNMSKSKISKVINYEAKQYIPISLEEVIFDWSIINENEESDNRNKNVKVLLVAILKEVAEKYITIASTLGLELIALETESFSLARSLIGSEKGSFVIVDIGNKVTNTTVVENGYVLSSHSAFGTGGKEITKAICHRFNISFERAERLKKDVGLNFSESQKKVSEAMFPIINIIISETRKISETYVKNNKKVIKKVIITGGTANLPGLVEYFSSELNISAEIGNPWKNIAYNKILSEKLKNMSSSFSIAVGLALRGFEE